MLRSEPSEKNYKHEPSMNIEQNTVYVGEGIMIFITRKGNSNWGAGQKLWSPCHYKAIHYDFLSRK